MNTPAGGRPMTMYPLAMIGGENRSVCRRCTPANQRRKRILIFDMDLNIIDQECIDELREI